VDKDIICIIGVEVLNTKHTRLVAMASANLVVAQTIMNKVEGNER
jgi:hypothetical protein